MHRQATNHPRSYRSASLSSRRRLCSSVPVPFETAGDLVRLLGSVPAGTPVRLAEHVRVADDLDLGHTPAETVTAARAGHAGDGLGGPAAAGIELGTYVVARGSEPPARAVAFPAYESAVEALERGDTQAALRAQVELLEWMAATLATAAADPERPPGAAAAVADPRLGEYLDVESHRIRNTARRLEAVRTKLAEAERRRPHADAASARHADTAALRTSP